MSDPDPKRQLAELDARIAAVKAAASTQKPHQEEHYSQAQMAWRMVIELVAGLGIGFGIGYGLDILFGTLPWLMIVFTMLGLAAGIKTMIRSAEEIQRTKLADTAGQNEGNRDGD